jgi:outer membrane immunogenic protein
MRTKFASLLTTAALSLGAAQVASAADLPARGPVYKAAPVAPFIDWTGFYVGGHIGGGWGTKDIFDPSQVGKEVAS